MTPEDVKEQLGDYKIEDMMHPKDSEGLRLMGAWGCKLSSLRAQRRVLKWEFNSFHDGANYTVGDYRFWFQLKEGHVKAGYAHIHRGGGFGGTLETKTCYGKDPFKGITTLQQIDQLFQFMHPEYK